LEEAIRSTAYAAFVKPFQRRKHVREAWLALLGQYKLLPAGEKKEGDL
jgi:hypothetical protein